MGFSRNRRNSLFYPECQVVGLAGDLARLPQSLRYPTFLVMIPPRSTQIISPALRPVLGLPLLAVLAPPLLRFFLIVIFIVELFACSLSSRKCGQSSSCSSNFQVLRTFIFIADPSPAHSFCPLPPPCALAATFAGFFLNQNHVPPLSGLRHSRFSIVPRLFKPRASFFG